MAMPIVGVREFTPDHDWPGLFGEQTEKTATPGLGGGRAGVLHAYAGALWASSPSRSSPRIERMLAPQLHTSAKHREAFCYAMIVYIIPFPLVSGKRDRDDRYAPRGSSL